MDRNHSTAEWYVLEGNIEDHEVQLPFSGQGHLSLDQGA